ncbi:hypothetical protein GLOTRDRAFT_136868 [Gloeophyllum trabeum ATCC 11539]|uniref:Protein kinase domain-containing protein n=1 Tax=Gloeophyllum trabeum (strain ATCC 11539 / FP-39264 / Madison 617) TaxID=670483 RepID=S7QFB6_GLOTA|nr:uncharacterized protein GLOTRDRAFT_136868 [Gloeophyllum trabeum ATCC 11539]EPQ58087.1 hypothetical protein GLOTRDRAFT_136868 [Gloeophyllum trabeum ATCC 11539]
MSRTLTFPALLWRAYCTSFVWGNSMKPRPPPVEGLELELELGKFIGAGRSGHVYEARVLNAEQLQPSLGGFKIPRLCIKLAEPNRLRSLAREAWFYEQLDAAGAQGVVVPRNFGFFTTQCSFSQVVPWRGSSWAFHDEMEHPADTSDIHDWLPHEPEHPELYRDDEEMSNENSQWKHWKWDKNGVQAVGLMIMERLGKEMDAPAMYTFYNGEKKEVLHLLQDLALAGVWHGDIRLNQIVRCKLSLVCPRHGYAHRWRVIDFDRSYAVTAVDEERALLARIGHRVFRFPTFWGGGSE